MLPDYEESFIALKIFDQCAIAKVAICQVERSRFKLPLEQRFDNLAFTAMSVCITLDVDKQLVPGVQQGNGPAW